MSEKSEVSMEVDSSVVTVSTPTEGETSFRGKGGQQRRRGGNREGGRRDRQSGPEKKQSDLIEKVVFINRCAKVVKGGRRFSFSAFVVVGDGIGKVGTGFGKANEVADAIRKANEAARKSIRPVSLHKGTIPHEVTGKFGGGCVLIKPASAGTGLIAGGGVRAVLEVAGVKDVLSKSMGSDNPVNAAKATMQALENLRDREVILRARGKVKK